MRSWWKAGLLGGVLVLTGLAPEAGLAGQVPGFEADSRPLVAAITARGVVAHMNELQWIADYYGGHRSAASAGYAASVSYVRRRLEAAGYATRTQSFLFPLFQERAKPILAAGATSFVPGRDVETFELSGSADVTGRLVAIPGRTPPAGPDPSDQGCEQSDFPRAGAAAAIAVIQRGGCTFDSKVQHAVAAGYDAVVIFNDGQPGRTEAVHGALGSPGLVPVVGASHAAGTKLAAAAARSASGRVRVHARLAMRRSYNLLAETRSGRSDRTVMVGAHLDSVREGPGINDNGSGSAAVLELALQMARLKIRPANRVRFAWWGAEELGLYGSQHYVDRLSPAERAAILAYLNFDMIASPNYVWMIQQGDPASSADALIEKLFATHFQRSGLPWETTAGGASDYLPFMEAGIPVGGLYSGSSEIKTRAQAARFGGWAGHALDPCYHRPCDTNRRISRRSTLVLSRAIADTVHKLAMTGRDLRTPPAAPASATRAAIASPPPLAEARGRHLIR
ncbi:M20/M25/M40 family metallo-hydrolase [Geminicoccus roseus]|uniref:M20/M25/M40 family metallo-hydrolase n=1 Tax=Geminicoccus roseus TaxID=404900 RepID=UPI000401B910|nr:M20/M25/M40 family metallo-hydrolase [Geminicoccus roseus]